MPDQKNNLNEVARWFSNMWVPKFLLAPKKIRIFVPKTSIFPQNMQFCHFDAIIVLVGSMTGWLVVVARGLLLR